MTIIMRTTIILLLLILTTDMTYSQYPFEQYPSPTYKEYNDWKFYDWSDTKQTLNHTLTIDQFFDNKDVLTVQLTTLVPSEGDLSSVIRIFRNQTEIQKALSSAQFYQHPLGQETEKNHRVFLDPITRHENVLLRLRPH